MPDYEEVSPRPEALIESLRAFGYTIQTAIADLIDNSVTAKATNVDVDFQWNGPQSWIRLTDNGEGMDEKQLSEAMALGYKSPLDERNPKDLGRFGLGLKTASFSQCRSLTVLSTRGGKDSVRCWDLDFVQKERKWALLRQPTSKEDADILRHKEDWTSRTVILWKKLDRVVGTEPVGNKRAESNFWAKAEMVERHLGMVFHRFLAKPKSLRIRINSNLVKAWDPFMISKVPLTQLQPAEEFGSGYNYLRVQPYVLPHQSKLTASEHEEGTGPNGWNAQQGFYIYRNERMIAAGDWLGFYRQEEHYKLARIQLDILNSADHAWRVDVRKAHVIPPDEFRADLKRMADATRRRAEDVYRTRGHVAKRKSAEPGIYMWLECRTNGKIHYKINREHPVIRRALSADSVTKKEFATIIRMIEETMPGHLVVARFAENAENLSMPFESNTREIEQMAMEVANVLLMSGLNHEEVLRRLRTMEPFQYYPELIDELNFELSSGGAYNH